MVTTIRAVFDRGILRPEQPLELQQDESYIVTIESETLVNECAGGRPSDGGYVHPLTRIRRMAVDMGIDDLSINHDHYAHGTSKIGDDDR